MNQGSYVRHRKTVHGNKSLKKYKCELCGYSTHAPQYLREHNQRQDSIKISALKYMFFLKKLNPFNFLGYFWKESFLFCKVGNYSSWQK